MEKAKVFTNCPVAGKRDCKGKNEIYDNGSKREEEVESGMTNLLVPKGKERDYALQHPEKNESTSNDESAGKRRNVLEKFHDSMHRKGRSVN